MNNIQNESQLAATLDYIAKWADMLEAMRRQEMAQCGGVFPTLAAGPLQEIRTNLDIAREFVKRSCATNSPPQDQELRHKDAALTAA